MVKNKKVITFVCTGNTCRSPMAEGYAKEYIKKHNLTNIKVGSCGLCVYGAELPSSNAVDAMRKIGIDILSHRSKMLDENILKETDIFFCMTCSHKEMLDEIISRVEHVNNVSLHKTVRVLGDGVPDPYGGNLAKYEMARDTIIKQVDIAFGGIQID